MFWFVVGYARLKFSGEDVLKCFEKIQKSHTELKNINKMSGYYYADVKRNDIKKVYNICREMNIDVFTDGRFGLAMKLFVHRNRIAFIISLVACVAMLFLKSSFIREIKISGNNYLSDRQIEIVLKECGLSRGIFIPHSKPHKVSSLMLERCSHLSWVWVEIKGTTAFVDVREKISKPDFYDDSYACNIIAEKDGVISEAISENGINYAFAGKYVRKGQLLIGGIYDSNEYAPVRFVRAKGSVKAKVTYSLSDTYTKKFTRYSVGKKCGDVKKICLFGVFAEFGKTESKNALLAKTTNKYFKIFGKKFSSLGFTNEQYYEIIKTEYITDEQTAMQRAKKELSQRLRSNIPHDAVIIDEKSFVANNPDGSFLVTVTAECIEDIGCESRIEISD